MGNYVVFTINAGSLKFLLNGWYEVYVSTFYMYKEFGQIVQINIVDDEQPPVVFIELSFLLKIIEKTLVPCTEYLFTAHSY